MGLALVNKLEVDNLDRKEVNEEVGGSDRPGEWKYLVKLTEENDCVSIDRKVMSLT